MDWGQVFRGFVPTAMTLDRQAIEDAYRKQSMELQRNADARAEKDSVRQQKQFDAATAKEAKRQAAFDAVAQMESDATDFNAAMRGLGGMKNLAGTVALEGGTLTPEAAAAYKQAARDNSPEAVAIRQAGALRGIDPAMANSYRKDAVAMARDTMMREGMDAFRSGGLQAALDLYNERYGDGLTAKVTAKDPKSGLVTITSYDRSGNPVGSRAGINPNEEFMRSIMSEADPSYYVKSLEMEQTRKKNESDIKHQRVIEGQGAENIALRRLDLTKPQVVTGADSTFMVTPTLNGKGQWAAPTSTDLNIVPKESSDRRAASVRDAVKALDAGLGRETNALGQMISEGEVTTAKDREVYGITRSIVEEKIRNATKSDLNANQIAQVGAELFRRAKAIRELPGNEKMTANDAVGMALQTPVGGAPAAPAPGTPAPATGVDYSTLWKK